MERPSPRRGECEFDHLDQHLHRLERKLDAIMRQLNVVILLEEIEMAALDDLEVKVQANTDAGDAMEKVLEEVSQALKDAISSGDPARVAAVSAKLDENTARWAAAAVANTPVAPAP